MIEILIDIIYSIISLIIYFYTEKWLTKKFIQKRKNNLRNKIEKLKGENYDR